MLADRKDAIRDAIARCEEQIAAITQKFEQNPPEDEEAAHAMLVEATKYRDNIVAYEREMRRMVLAMDRAMAPAPRIAIFMSNPPERIICFVFYRLSAPLSTRKRLTSPHKSPIIPTVSIRTHLRCL